MTTRTWLRHCTAKCYFVTFPLNNRYKKPTKRKNNISREKSICNGKNLRDRKCLSMMSVSGKNLRRSTTKRWEMHKISKVNWKILNWITLRRWRKSNLKVSLLKDKLKKSLREKECGTLRDKKELLRLEKTLKQPMKISLRFKLRLLSKRKKKREEFKSMLPKRMRLTIWRRLRKKRDSDKNKQLDKH